VILATSTSVTREQLADVVDRLARPAPKLARLLEAAEPDLLAFAAVWDT
jgi:hypothetical protein